jgi:hypothetical protein
MADPRLECFAADALARGWEIFWPENDDRTELLVIPTLSSRDPELPLDPMHQRMFSFGFGVALGHPRQDPPITFWAHQSWGGNSFICPWAETEHDQQRLDRCPPGHELKLFPTVNNFDEGLALFDQGMARYMACMRRIVLQELGELDHLHVWADPAPLVAADV